METVLELLKELARRGVKLSVEGDDLSCYMQNGSLTEEIRECIVQNKVRILNALRDYRKFEPAPTNKGNGTQGTGFTPRVIVLKTHYQSTKNYNYLIVDPPSREAVIVDPAWQMETIDATLMETQAKLAGILITHSHPDHINLARPIAEKYDCPIWMSKEEIAASGFAARQLSAIDGDRWTVGQMLIEPILTPGHTPGCVCYLIGNNLFSGDVLFAEGCGICPDVPAAHAMFASLKNLKARLKPQTRIFPGHSYGKPPGQTLSQLLRENIYLHFSDKHSFAAFRLRSGQDNAKMFNFS